jgi:hypothetical protein
VILSLIMLTTLLMVIGLVFHLSVLLVMGLLVIGGELILMPLLPTMVVILVGMILVDLILVTMILVLLLLLLGLLMTHPFSLLVILNIFLTFRGRLILLSAGLLMPPGMLSNSAMLSVRLCCVNLVMHLLLTAQFSTSVG